MTTQKRHKTAIPGLIAALCLAFFAVPAPAGGGEYEAAIARITCNPIVIPDDLVGEGWRWIKAHDRLKVSAGDNEIREFQTLYCREFTTTGGLQREYVGTAEWWRPRARKPKAKSTGGH